MAEKGKHGGKRTGSGRKSKADELKLIERMDAILAPDELWAAIAEKVKLKDMKAATLWAAYRYGQPKASMDHTTDGQPLPATVINLGAGTDSKTKGKK